MEQTVGSYEEEKATYLSNRRSFAIANAKVIREAHDAYLDAIQKMQQAYEDDLAKLEHSWKELCRQNGWEP